MPNFDETTGIRYGVISPHSISSFALDDIYQKGIDPHYEYGREELMKELESFCDDHNLKFHHINTDSFIDEYSDNYQGNDDGQMDYSDNEYTIHVSGDNFGIFVMKSPYYTYCRGCSPCAPGAGDLDSPIDPTNLKLDALEHISAKTLCLGPEWFDKEESEYARKISYRVFRVDNDQEVE